MSSASPTAAPSSFVWYELLTPQPEPAEAFYKNVFGWGIQDSGMPGQRYTLLTVGGIPIGGLMGKPTGLNAKPGWMGYLGVPDVDAYSERVKQAGGTVHRAADTIPGVGRFAVVADPQEAVFVLFEPLSEQQQPQRPAPGAPGSPAWHELSAADWQSDFAFYSNLFGWSKTDAMDMGPSGVYQMFAAGAGAIGGMMTRMDPSQPTGWLFYFHVDEIEAAIARVKQHGGTILHGPAAVPGGQQIAVCLDPQGAGFGMATPSKN